jgi:hypothetical protein
VNDVKWNVNTSSVWLIQQWHGTLYASESTPLTCVHIYKMGQEDLLVYGVDLQR